MHTGIPPKGSKHSKNFKHLSNYEQFVKYCTRIGLRITGMDYGATGRQVMLVMQVPGTIVPSREHGSGSRHTAALLQEIPLFMLSFL